MIGIAIGTISGSLLGSFLHSYVPWLVDDRWIHIPLGLGFLGCLIGAQGVRRAIVAVNDQ